jgi:hypothetical protein
VQAAKQASKAPRVVAAHATEGTTAAAHAPEGPTTTAATRGGLVPRWMAATATAASATAAFSAASREKSESSPSGSMNSSWRLASVNPRSGVPLRSAKARRECRAWVKRTTASAPKGAAHTWSTPPYRANNDRTPCSVRLSCSAMPAASTLRSGNDGLGTIGGVATSSR